MFRHTHVLRSKYHTCIASHSESWWNCNLPVLLVCRWMLVSPVHFPLSQAVTSLAVLSHSASRCIHHVDHNAVHYQLAALWCWIQFSAILDSVTANCKQDQSGTNYILYQKTALFSVPNITYRLPFWMAVFCPLVSECDNLWSYVAHVLTCRMFFLSPDSIKELMNVV